MDYLVFYDIKEICWNIYYDFLGICDIYPDESLSGQSYKRLHYLNMTLLLYY